LDYIKGYYLKDDKQLKCISSAETRKVLKKFKKSHPEKLTEKDLYSVVTEGTATKALSSLKDGGFIVEGGKMPIKKSRKPAMTFHFEDLNFVSNENQGSEIPYAPGYVYYDENFLQAYKLLIEKDEDQELYRLFNRRIGNIFKKVFLSEDPLVRQMAPRIDNFCPGCGFNHEARDFIRALMLHLMDEFERDPQFLAFLKEKNLVDDKVYSQLLEQVSQEFVQIGREKINPITVRLLSLTHYGNSRYIRFFGLTDDIVSSPYIYGLIDSRSIKNLFPGTIIELDPILIDTNSDDTLFVRLEYDDYIKPIENSSFPSIDAVTTKISRIRNWIGQTIDYADLPGDIMNFYVVEGVILVIRDKRQKVIDGHSVEGIEMLIGDDTGEVDVFGTCEDELNRGDKVIVFGARAFFDYDIIPVDEHGYLEYNIKNVKLSTSAYGSIVKIDQYKAHLS
jgi:hypothetical protein